MSEPIVAKYRKDLSDDQRSDVMKFEFPDLFARFDVLDSGFIEVEQMGRFFKAIAHDQTIDI